MSSSRNGLERHACSVLEQVLESPEDARRAEVERLCGSDRGLREEVLALLAAVDDAGRLFDEPLVRLVGDDGGAVEERPLPTLDRYRLVRFLGAGGMADVYLAERSDGAFRRRVAVKVVRATLGAPALERRFRRERQVLADLDHPGIARLLDGGTLPDGRPYLVMELVDGLPLDRYCERHELSVDERLRLFLRVCEAVAHAHERGVLHRDLKPSNVLVTAAGAPHLIDFGIATLLDGGPGAASGETSNPALLPLTPSYASPEQLAGQPLTATSDVYALGLLLRRLLTGLAPGARDRRHDEGSGARPLRDLGRDLEAIAGKALRRRPEDRYASVRDLAADVHRHLTGLPVTARRGSLGYRWSRHLRRHGRLAAGGVLLLAISLGLAGLWLGERRQGAAAGQRLEVSRQAVLDVLQQFDPLFAPGGDFETQSRAVASAAQRLEERFSEQPGTLATMLDTLAAIAARLGDLDLSRRLVERAGEVGARAQGEQRYRRGLAWLLLEQGELQDVQRQVRSWARWPESEEAGVSDEELVEALVVLGESYLRAGDMERSQRLFEQAIQQARALPAPVTEFEPFLLARLATYHEGAEERRTAESRARQALRVAPADSVVRADALAALAWLTWYDGRWAVAERLLHQALDILRRRLPPDHQAIGVVLNNLGGIELSAGDASSALQHLSEARRIVEAVLPADSMDVIASICVQARGFHAVGDQTAAERTWLECRRRLERLLVRNDNPAARFYLSYPLVGLGMIAVERGAPAEAEPLLRRAVELRRDQAGHEAWKLFEAEGELADCLLRLGRSEEGALLLRRSHRVLTAELPEGDLRRRRSAARVITWAAVLDQDPRPADPITPRTLR